MLLIRYITSFVSLLCPNDFLPNMRWESDYRVLTCCIDDYMHMNKWWTVYFWLCYRNTFFRMHTSEWLVMLLRVFICANQLLFIVSFSLLSPAVEGKWVDLSEHKQYLWQIHLSRSCVFAFLGSLLNDVYQIKTKINKHAFSGGQETLELQVESVVFCFISFSCFSVSL